MENLIYYHDNGNKNQHKKIEKRQRKISIGKNEYWQEVLQVNQPTFPESS